MKKKKQAPQDTNQFARDVEQSLRKKFKKSIFSKFAKAINTYELVKPGDSIAVCISGGKDSMLYGAQMQSMMPKLHSTNFEGSEYNYKKDR